MMQTIDGKVIGKWFERPEAEFAMIDFLEREKTFKVDAFLNGVNTYLSSYIRENFTPDLSKI